jgi:hypothetical protein
MRRALLVAPLLLMLAGCTAIGQFSGPDAPALGGDAPAAAPTASATPSATPTPTPEPTSTDCDDPVLIDPGEYHLPDCLEVTVQGHDIHVVAQSIGTLIIDGNANEVDAGEVGTVSIDGNVNRVDTLDLGDLDIDGRFNRVGVHGSVESVEVRGNDNDVIADGDIGSITDHGESNLIASQP